VAREVSETNDQGVEVSPEELGLHEEMEPDRLMEEPA